MILSRIIQTKSTKLKPNQQKIIIVPSIPLKGIGEGMCRDKSETWRCAKNAIKRAKAELAQSLASVSILSKHIVGFTAEAVRRTV